MPRKMKGPDEPLEYPGYYPPTDKWKKFFNGVRWIGPDISFFKDLRKQQGSRTPDCMKAWKTVKELDLALQYGRSFNKWWRWPTDYFLPDDKLNTIFGGPKFDSMGMDQSEFEESLKELEDHIGYELPEEFWRTSKAITLGELVNDIIKRGKQA